MLKNKSVEVSPSVLPRFLTIIVNDNRRYVVCPIGHAVLLSRATNGVLLC